ncbi:MAG: hypothetical protein CMN84_11315 [Spongiibacteraceae bacterium]|nr:hypothetical protein [Spongiibacteraceae bacterium]|tara:strand:+ start:238 stop:498 length:261 start_codon:yes stop_codon:yes gene_type:complete
MSDQHTIYVNADIYDAAMRLLSREQAVNGDGSAIQYADQLILAHSVAGLEEAEMFWVNVWRYLMEYEVAQYPFSVCISKPDETGDI